MIYILYQNEVDIPHRNSCCMNSFSILVTYSCILIKKSMVSKPTNTRVAHYQVQGQVGHILPKSVVCAVMTFQRYVTVCMGL